LGGLGKHASIQVHLNGLLTGSENVRYAIFIPSLVRPKSERPSTIKFRSRTVSWRNKNNR